MRSLSAPPRILLRSALLAACVGGCLSMLLLAPAFGATLSAQTSQTGAMQGRVSTPDGRPLANATVTVKQADGSYPRTTRTDDRGEFRINFITPGEYRAEVRLLGYGPHDRGAVLVRATEVTRLEVTMQPSATELAAVNVTASAVTIDKTTTEYSSSL